MMVILGEGGGGAIHKTVYINYNFRREVLLLMRCEPVWPSGKASGW